MTSIVLRNSNHGLDNAWRWSWEPLRALSAWMDSDSWPSVAEAADFAPRMDVHETEAAYILSADLPGVKADGVDISVENSQLKIAGRRESSHREDKEHVHLSERNYGSFRRVFALPETADTAKVDAELKDGILTVTVAKKAEAKPRTIAVKVNA